MGYPYRPLDPSSHEIRILHWVPSQDENSNKVECKLVHVSLDEDPDYDALSYTWGDPQPSQTIVVDGVEVSVGPSLYGALNQIGHANRPLWVDSICINQDDQQERTDQVCLMGDIYGKADIVIMWLGEDEDDGDAALVFLENFQEQLKSPGGIGSLMMSDNDFDDAWIAVGKLFKRPYWCRLWIIQEVLLARNPVVCCGAASCSWDFIQLILPILDTRATVILSATAREALLYPSTDLVRTLARLYHQRFEGRKMSLIDCLALGRQRKATDPRDHIYGMLNLVEAADIVPDYTISADTLYRMVAWRIIEQDKNLDVLSACVNKRVNDMQVLTGEDGQVYLRIKDPSISTGTDLEAATTESLTELFTTVVINDNHLPSWVPDWRIWTNDANFMFVAKSENCQYRASKDTAARTRFDEKDSNVLTVEGFILDEVHATSQRQTVIDDDAEDNNNLIPDLVAEEWAIWESAKPEECPYGDLAAQELAFEKTLFFGRDCGSIQKPVMSKRLIGKATGDERVYPEVTAKIFIEDYFKEDLSDGQSCALNHRFMVTTKGYMGRGPLEVREGDIAVVLFGAKVPFMLRKVEDKYILLGECYIHGVMDGESLDELDRGLHEEQEFCLI